MGSAPGASVAVRKERHLMSIGNHFHYPAPGRGRHPDGPETSVQCNGGAWPGPVDWWNRGMLNEASVRIVKPELIMTCLREHNTH